MGAPKQLYQSMNTSFPIAVVEALRKRIRCLEGGARQALLPFGIKAIDELRTRGDAPSRANSELSLQARRGEGPRPVCDYPSYKVAETSPFAAPGPFELIRCRGGESAEW
jgi:hypothetical protein